MQRFSIWASRSPGFSQRELSSISTTWIECERSLVSKFFPGSIWPNVIFTSLALNWYDQTKILGRFESTWPDNAFNSLGLTLPDPTTTKILNLDTFSIDVVVVQWGNEPTTLPYDPPNISDNSQRWKTWIQPIYLNFASDATVGYPHHFSNACYCY